jgi:hypothetical protein
MRAMKRGLLVLLLVVTFGLAGCRLAGGAPPTATPSPSAEASPESVPSPSPSASAAAGMLEAPEQCGFPAGTALEFADRSSYAELRVGDAKGDSIDPMSDEPADIYITRDPITQEGGRQLGRFVCAIFVGENEGFVEITMHPEDWDRYSPVPLPGEPANGLTADEATAAAHAALDGGEEWRVHLSGSGPMGDFLSPESWDERWEGEFTADRWVWAVSAWGDTQAVGLMLDYVDGTVVARAEVTLDECGRDPSDSEYGTEPCPDL